MTRRYGPTDGPCVAFKLSIQHWCIQSSLLRNCIEGIVLVNGGVHGA
jgi:hypothetical protein